MVTIFPSRYRHPPPPPTSPPYTSPFIEGTGTFSPLLFSLPLFTVSNTMYGPLPPSLLDGVESERAVISFLDSDDEGRLLGFTTVQPLIEDCSHSYINVLRDGFSYNGAFQSPLR